MFETDGQLIPGTMCDHEFVSSQTTPQHGRFYSPRYPSSYPKNIRCSYLFRARLKERIRIIFEEISLQRGDLRQPQSGGHKIACNFAREPYRISIVHAQRPLQCRLRTGNHPSNG
ncbi:hypothetical protein PV326_004094, partial [Microctonus aethiopoides]